MANTLSNRVSKARAPLFQFLGCFLFAAGSIGIAFAAFFSLHQKAFGYTNTFEGNPDVAVQWNVSASFFIL
jgi:hypothetical protein